MNHTKRIFISITSAICATLTLFGFVACKDENKTSTPTVYKDDYITASGYAEYINLGDGLKNFEIVLEKDRVVPEVTDEHSWAEYDISTGISANTGYSIRTWYTDESKTDSVQPVNGTVLYGTNDYFFDVVNADGDIVKTYAILINGVCKSGAHVWSEWHLAGQCFGTSATARTCEKCAKTEKKNVVERSWHNYVNGVCDVCTEEVTPTEAFSFVEASADFAFAQDLDGYILVSVTGELPENVIIPDYYEQKKVVGIANYAFQGQSSVKSVKIPDTVVALDDGVFQDCTALHTVNLPEELTLLGTHGGCFSGCTSLTAIKIPYGIKEIPDTSFWNCTSLQIIEFPAGLTKIGDYAFENTAITRLELPQGLTTIGRMAFEGCSELTDVEIPDSLTSIGDGAFGYSEKMTYTEWGGAKYLGNGKNPHLIMIRGSYEQNLNFAVHENTKFLIGFVGSPRITQFTVPKNLILIANGVLGSVAVERFAVADGNVSFKAVNGNLYSCDGKTLVSYANGKTDETEFTVLDGVEKISSHAITSRTLKNITVPKSVKYICGSAFNDLALDSFTYQGTIAEWEAIEKEAGWCFQAGGGNCIQTVICSDGTATVI